MKKPTLTAEALRRRIYNVVGVGTWQMEQLLALLEIVVDPSVATAAVECRITPRLLINPDFVREHCATDEALFMLVLHELHHVVLGHTRLFDRPTLAHNIAFDAIINAMLCTQFPNSRYVRFFQDINGADSFPSRLLRPPPGWPEVLVFPADATSTEKRVLTLLYGPGNHGATYLDVFNLLVDDYPSVAVSAAVYLGNHEDSAAAAAADPLVTGALARIVGAWPRPPRNLGGRDEGQEGDPWLMTPPVDPSSRLRTALRTLLRRAGILTGAPGGTWRTRSTERPRTVDTVLIQHRDRRVPAWRTLHGTWPVLYRSKVTESRRGPVPQPVAHVYLDISGSMDGVLPVLGGALAEPHRQGLVRLFVFSTVVDEIPPRRLHGTPLRNTLGTDINCVLRHLLDLPPSRRPKRVVLITDGYVGKPRFDLLSPLQARGVRFYAGLTPGGLTLELDHLDANIITLPL